MSINHSKLNKEIGIVAEELKFLKNKINSPEFQVSHADKPNWFYFNRRYFLKIKFTKMLALKALMRGKNHFSEHSRFNNWYGPKSRNRDDILEWVSDIKPDFY